MRTSRALPTVGTLALAALLAGCAADADAGDAGTGSTAGFPVTVDNCGEEVTFDAAPESVFTLGTSAVWNLDVAGAGDRIVARSGEFDAGLGTDELNERYADIPVVDPSDPTAETIVGSGAELVVGYGFFNTDKAALEELGIESLENLGDCGHDGVVDPPAFTIDMMLDDIRRFGQVFGTSDIAEANVAELESELAELEASRPAEDASAVILYYFGTDLGTHGGTNVSNDVLARAGFTNVFADEDTLYLNPSLETIVDSDADYLIVHYGVQGESFEEARDAILQESGISDMRAVVEGNIIGVPYDALTATPGAIAGVRTLIEGRTP